MRSLNNATRDNPSICNGLSCGCRDAQRTMKLNVQHNSMSETVGPSEAEDSHVTPNP